jgi:hypothetical protein
VASQLAARALSACLALDFPARILMESRNNIVVSKEGVYMRRFLFIAAVCIAIVVAALMYELGLSRAGFNRLDAMTNRARLEYDNLELKRLNKQLSEKVAILETSTKIDRESYKRVEKELADLQSRIVEQEEDVEFYKGIFDDQDGAGVRIQDFHISPGDDDKTFVLRLVLAQAFQSDEAVSGYVEIILVGQRNKQEVRLKMDELAIPKRKKDMDYSFRYFQDLRTEVVIPPDFTPEQVHVIAHVGGKRSKTVEDFFVWSVE